MEIPNNVKIYEGELATFWFDKDDILCAIAKKVPCALETQKTNYVLIKKLQEITKVCLFSDTTSSNPQDKETHDFAAKELENYFIAMAFISNKAVWRFLGHKLPLIKKLLYIG